MGATNLKHYDTSVWNCSHSNDFTTLFLRPLTLIVEEKMGSPEHAVEIIRDKKWTVRVTSYGNTLTVPFEAESHARSYADGQAFRLGVEVAEHKKCA